jgi:restriction system protein
MFNNYWQELLKQHNNTQNNTLIDIVVKNGIDYENYVEKYLQNLGYNVIRTPKTGDQGVDLIAEKNGDRKAIQCKYYSRPVGNKAVQEVIAGTNFYQCISAAVISNASFTKSARKLAENSNVKLISLIPQ